MDVVPCMDSAVQANDLIELTPTVKMESGHPEEGPFGCEVLLGSHRGLKSQVIEDFGGKFAFFEKKMTTYGEIFKILFQKNSSPHQSTSCVQIS